MAIRRHKLEYKEDFGFLLFGISTPETDYRIVWKLNQDFSLNLVRGDNHTSLSRKTGQLLEFPFYSYDDEDTFYLYHLLGNKSGEGFLIEELRNIDYFLIIRGDFTEAFSNGVFNRLRKTENIQAVFKIEPESLKSRENLLF